MLRPLMLQVEKEVKLAMAEVGFNRKKIWYVKAMGNSTLGAIGLPRATYPSDGIFLYRPTVAIFNEAVEQLVTKWLGRDSFKKLSPPTTLEHLKILMPQGSRGEWEFTYESSKEATISDMLKAIQEYGVPFIQKNIDLEQLLQQSLKNPVIGVRKHYIPPAIYVLLGRIEEARAYVKLILDRIEKNDSSYQWGSMELGWKERYKEVMTKIFEFE